MVGWKPVGTNVPTGFLGLNLSSYLIHYALTGVRQDDQGTTTVPLILQTYNKAFLFKPVNIFGGSNRSHAKQGGKLSYGYLLML